MPQNICQWYEISGIEQAPGVHHTRIITWVKQIGTLDQLEIFVQRFLLAQKN